MAKQTTAVATVPRLAQVIRIIEERADDFAASLPRSIPSDRFVRVIKTALGNSPELAECNAGKLLTECQKCAADGLVLDGRLAALICFNTKIKEKKNGQWVERWEKVPKYIPMYQGLILRCYNSGLVRSISANLVYEEELKINPATKRPRFMRTIDGRGEIITHDPILTGKRGPLIGLYSMAMLQGGLVNFHYMTIEDCDKIQGRSRGKKKDKDGKEYTVGPWKTDPDQMRLKTVIRRHSKTLPMDSDLARVFARDDDLYDAGETPQPAPATVRARGSAASKLNDDAPLDGDIIPPDEDDDYQGDDQNDERDPDRDREDRDERRRDDDQPRRQTNKRAANKKDDRDVM